MIIVKHTIESSKLPNLQLNSDQVIFDIETTGFSAKYAYIYMIGLLAYDSTTGTFVLEQWFREKESDEYEMLFKFNQRLLSTSVVYSFNGDQFDFPFIIKRMALYSLKINTYTSIDMLKRLRPYKKSLGLENLKLKTVEAFYGYDRVDPFTGGDLIKLYTTYLETLEEHLYQTLLLHNHEDLLGLGALIGHLPVILTFDDYKNGLLSVELTESTIENGTYRAVFSFPISTDIELSNELYTLKIKEHRATLTLPTTVDTLNLYFDNPSEYYYLPNEDYAVHKSIGQFVHKDHRIKATRDNCYVKKEDFFLPGYRSFQLPAHLYYKKTKDPVGYYSVQDLVELALFDSYIAKLLTKL